MVGLIDFVELWCGGGVGVGGGGVHKICVVQMIRWFLTTLKALLKVATVVVVVHAGDDVCDEGGLGRMQASVAVLMLMLLLKPAWLWGLVDPGEDPAAVFVPNCSFVIWGGAIGRQAGVELAAGCCYHLLLRRKGRGWGPHH